MTAVIEHGCAVLIPSCSEPDIEQTIESVGYQTCRPVVTVVVLNNCHDNGKTRHLAQRSAAKYGLNLVILEMGRNDHMKAGALNFGYDWIRNNYPSVEYLVQMDADSMLSDDFVENTMRAYRKIESSGIGALSCAFIGKPDIAKTRWQGIVMWFQRLEYVKFHDSGVVRNVSVVSGTGCVLRVSALEDIRELRGYVWAIDSLVEDFELTLRLRTMGWETRKSHLFRVYTDLMPSVRSLVKQRERWQRGTNDELRRFGFNRHTALDVLKQWFHGLGVIINAVVLSYVVVLISMGQLAVSALILILIGMIMLRQAYHARSLGFRTSLFAATLIPDILYGAVRNYWWTKAIILSLGRSEKSWT